MMKQLVKFLFGKRNYTVDQKAAIKDYGKLVVAWSLIFEVVYFISFFVYVKKLEKDENFYNKNKKLYEKVLSFFNCTWRKLKELFSFAPDRSSDVDENDQDDDYVDPDLE